MLLIDFLGTAAAWANPADPVVTQGAATFTTSGSQLTIRTSDQTAVNWSSFNIGLGQTTTFIQPSSTSVVWNRINDPNPSQILGTLNANGYVILQNPSGFYIGGQAVINSHGLLITTAPTPVPDLLSGGTWQFSAPPPTASIINYGQINIGGGGSAFLIAHDVQNHGTVSAQRGNIGLCAGDEVLISDRPDGRGLSAQVKLPAGSVDNSGRLIADGGAIALQAQVVNQGGLIQANSVRNVNGKIELLASDTINLGDNSVISAQGGSQGKSSGGSVAIKSDGSFSDSSTSVINISGGAQAGNGGDVEISAARMTAINSGIDGQAASGFINGKLTIDPYNIQLVSSGGTGTSGQYSSGTVNSSDDPANGTLILNVNSFSSTLSQINLQAANNIELSTLWNLSASANPATLSLTAGNSILFDNNTGIKAGNNWSVNLMAGPQNLSSTPGSGNGGIYLNGNAFIDTLNGNINLWAANEVIVNNGAIRTRLGGSINVTTQFGDVNTGNNINGYLFGQNVAPYYRVNAANLGGISTAAGGNVTINAGGNVISYLPEQSDYLSAKFDAGTGAFGSQPGNVSITAGGNVLGHYVLANGIGTITARGGNIGAASALDGGFALSLIKGSWDIQAPNGSIYVQDIRNPNGIFGERLGSSQGNYAGYHYFDYDPLASVSLHAGNSVEITGADAPHGAPSIGAEAIPLILPPTLKVTTDSGDFVLDQSVILFPSAQGDLNINVARNFIGVPGLDGISPNLEMSDSGGNRWVDSSSFGIGDHAATPPELNNLNPVEITVGGDLRNVNLYTTKATQIKVHGDMDNASFTGENLHPTDVTSIDVDGKIDNSPLYAFVQLNSGIVSANPLQPNAWDSVFSLALNPDMVASLANLNVNNLPFGQSLAYYLKLHNYLLFPSGLNSSDQSGMNPGFQYVSSGLQLGFKGNMASALAAGTITAQQLSALEGGQFTVLVADAHGNPVVDSNGHLETRTYTFGAASEINNLYTASLNATSTTAPLSGFQIGGPGLFKVHAGSLNLGNSQGILSWGIASGISSEARDYSSLAGLTTSGAAVDVEVDGDISMFTSTIASVFGGDVTVNAGGKIDLSLPGVSFTPQGSGYICYGIYTSGHSDVRVTAQGDVNIDNSRIGAFNGGSVFVESYNGDVNAGLGANDALYVPVVYKDPSSGNWISGQIGDYSSREAFQANPAPHGSGILAFSTSALYSPDGSAAVPGNILVETPQGDIVSSLGGIKQVALSGEITGSASVTLIAGTPASGGSPAIPGSVLLGQGGVVGGTVNVTAQGDIQGLIISKENANISAAQSFSGTVFSGGTANVNAGGSISGTLVGIGGVSASGGGDVSATMLSQNVSVGGQQGDSTLGTTATASASSQSAANQASSDAKEQVASNNTPDDEDEMKKKRGKSPALTRRVSRVTVILPASM